MDKKSLDNECACGSKKIAANCCRADEPCFCGSLRKVKQCCLKMVGVSAKKDK